MSAGEKTQMILAHLPAGYITVRLFLKRFIKIKISPTALFSWGILGAVAPDLDMLYFYLVDNRQHHHHLYWSHYPVVWFSLLGLSIVAGYIASLYKYSVYGLIFFLAGCVHLLLDSVVGDIWWLAPFVDQPFALATVPNRFQPWWLNFILHWSFLLELGIIFWAVWLWQSGKRCHTSSRQLDDTD